MNLSMETLAKLAAAYAGIVFGVYWFPVRLLGEAGFQGSWAAALLNSICLFAIVPLLAWRWRAFVFGSPRFHMAGLLTGMALALYGSSFLYTGVVRAILLFYLMPIWGFILGRIILKDPITPIRWISILLGFAGMLVIFGLNDGIPWPQNVGDWMAVCSGIVWSLGAIMMLTDLDCDSVDYGALFFVWGTLGAVALSLVATANGTIPAPDFAALPALLWWLIPTGLLLFLPAGFATIYGPTVLNPGVVGLIFMSEVSVATLSAALFAGEPFGLRETAGVLLLTLAAVLEPFLSFRRSKPA